MLPFGIYVIDLASHHVADDFILGDAAGRVHGADRRAVPQYGNRIRDGDDLLQAVGNHDQRNPLRLQLAQERKQVGAVILVQGGSRFIQNNQSGVLGQSLGDLNQLLAADADIRYLGSRIHLQADSL